MAGINDLLCGGDREAAAEIFGALEVLTETLAQQVRDMPDTVDRELVAQATRVLFHARCIVGLLRGGPGDIVSKTLMEFCRRWRPRVLEVCGGCEQRVTVYIVTATELAMRLGLSFDDLVAEGVSQQ